MADLVIVYGPPLTGRNEVAWAIARAMPGRSAVLSADSFLAGAIAVMWDDATAELEMAHVQLRLLAASYLKNRYHLVVEGPFLFERNGALISYESRIDQLVALMRNLALQSLVVRLDLDAAELRSRAEATVIAPEAERIVRVAAAYRVRTGPNVVTFDAASEPPEAIAAAVQRELSRLRALRGGP
jgi:hypothetical protein